MDMPKPTPAHKKLEKLVGSWRGEEKLHPSPWDPQGGPATGSAENRSGLAGFVVTHDYRQERDGQVTFEGHGVFSWDAARESYVLHWFDSMGLPPNEFVGRFEGDVLTMTCPGPQGLSRAVFDFGRPRTYGFRMDMSPDGKSWHPFMEGSYRRVD